MPNLLETIREMGMQAGGPGSGRHATYGQWKHSSSEKDRIDYEHKTGHLMIRKMPDGSGVVKHAPFGGKYSDESPLPDRREFKSFDEAKSFAKDRFGVS